MKKVAKAFLMALSMFSILPLRIRNWDEKARPYMTLCLPFVGMLLGGLWTGLALLLRYLGLPKPVSAAFLAAFPFWMTGAIHLDGFLDVTDAVKSWRDREERIRILKDPHVGSFAVIDTVLLMLLQFAFLMSLKEDADVFVLILIAVISRTAAALAVTLLKPLGTSEYAGAYRKGIKPAHIVFLGLVLICAAAAGFVFFGKTGWVSAAVLAGYLLPLARAVRSLGGMSGDISGYAMTIAELCGIACFALI